MLDTTAPVIMNAANEIVVRSFLNGDIKFLDIPDIIEQALNHFELSSVSSLDDVMGADKKVKDYVSKYIKNHFFGVKWACF